MPWGAMVGAVLDEAHAASGGVTSSADLRGAAFRRAERMARKRMLASAKPWLITLGVVIGLWAGYHAMLWVLWWNPHPIQQTPFYYG